jgi:hypothetical protein
LREHATRVWKRTSRPRDLGWMTHARA